MAIKDKDTAATVGVRDIVAARRFYGETLGLELLHDEAGMALTFKTGASKMLVYQSTFAGTNQATAVTWIVGTEIDALVRELAAKGISFEHYQLPQTTLDGDVHVSGARRVAWFKDPDGNIHSLVNGR